MVEFVAQHIVVALHGGADVAVLAVPAHADVRERGHALVDLREGFQANLGAAREKMAVFLEQALDVLDGVLLDVLQVLLRQLEFLLQRGDVLAVLVDFERRDPADGDLDEAFDLGIGDLPLGQLGDASEFGGGTLRDVRPGLDRVVERLHEGQPFVLELFESGPDGLEHGVLGLAGLDLLVDLLLDENLREGAGEDLVDALRGGDLEFPGQVLHELLGIAAEDVAGSHPHGPVVADDHVGAGHAHLAVGVGVEGVDGLLRAVAALK